MSYSHNTVQGALMKSPVRLDSISRKLADTFRRASEGQKRQAVLAASLLATQSAGLLGNDVDAAAELLRQGMHSDAMRRRLEAVSQRLDDQYLQLTEAQPESEIRQDALLPFRQARAASALAFALSSDPDDCYESVYEAFMASSDPAKTIAAVETALVTDR